MSSDADRLDRVRTELEQFLTDNIQRVTGAFDDATDAPPDAVDLLASVKAAQELTHNLVATELELRRLSRTDSADRSPEVQARIARLRSVEKQLTEGLGAIVGAMDDGGRS